MKYVVVYEETLTGFSAYVPDLPGCVAAGETREETERLRRERDTAEEHMRELQS